MNSAGLPPLGAYGLRLPDLPGQRWLGEAPSSWPSWSFCGLTGEYPDAQEFDSDRALLRSVSGAWHEISRTNATTTVIDVREHPEGAFVHPYLAMTAMIHAQWTQRLSLHGGAFVWAGGVWGLLGDRERGKSSTLAWLTLHDRAVICDDIIITDGNTIFSGPRCIDLREEAARHFGLGEDIGMIGERHRWRVLLEPVPAEAPLLGWVRLAWDDRVSCRRLGLEETFSALTDHRAFVFKREHPIVWLDAASKPAFEFARPRSWAAADDAMDALLTTLSDGSWLLGGG